MMKSKNKKKRKWNLEGRTTKLRICKHCRGDLVMLWMNPRPILPSPLSSNIFTAIRTISSIIHKRPHAMLLARPSYKQMILKFPVLKLTFLVRYMTCSTGCTTLLSIFITTTHTAYSLKPSHMTSERILRAVSD